MKYIFHILALLLFTSTYLFTTFYRDFQISYKYSKLESIYTINLSTLSKYFIFVTILHFLIDIFISYVSEILYNGHKFHNTLFFYLYEISSHVSSFIIITFYYFSILEYDFSLVWKFDPNSDTERKLNILNILKIFMIGISLFAVKSIIHRHISLSFNYGLHLNRIRESLIREYFLSIIKTLFRGYGLPVETLKFRVPWLSRRFSLSRTYSKINDYLFSDISLIEKDACIKRLILNEFRKASKSEIIGNPFKNAQKYKRHTYTKAKKISSRLVKSGYITYSTLSRYFESKEIFNQYLEKLKIPERMAIGPESLNSIMLKNAQEMYFLSESLGQMNSALERVGNILSFAIIFICLGIIILGDNENSNPLLSFFGTIFGTGFVLNASIENAVGCAVFLFFIHPYDVGDRVFIDMGTHLENLVVSELNVFSTVFIRWDGVVVVVPNQILRERPIINIRRSGVMIETHKIQIDVNTPTEKIETLKKELKIYLKSNPNHFTDLLMVNYDTIENNNILHLRIVMQYKKNWQNYELFLERKSMFLSVLNMILKNIGIDYKPLTQKISLSGPS